MSALTVVGGVLALVGIARKNMWAMCLGLVVVALTLDVGK